MKDKKAFIIFLNDASDQQLLCILKILAKEQLQTIIEIIYNVLHGVCTISDINKSILTKHKKLIRKIVSRRSTLTKRKKLLFKSRKILPIFFKPTLIMSRELILIPKLRYETLIKNEESTPEKLEDKSNTVEQNEKLIKNEESNNKTNTVEQNASQANDDLQILKTKKRTKIKNVTILQIGVGKSYINMKPNKFFNLVNKTKELTLKNKWLSFPI